jgi:hypothetical protein
MHFGFISLLSNLSAGRTRACWLDFRQLATNISTLPFFISITVFEGKMFPQYLTTS